ncbi:MAG: hypothetical protein F4X95_03940 [Oligoflexia bacterium]|nr:hypothetical protein [Oligoflexia bacterium]
MGSYFNISTLYLAGIILFSTRTSFSVPFRFFSFLGTGASLTLEFSNRIGYLFYDLTFPLIQDEMFALRAHL